MTGRCPVGAQQAASPTIRTRSPASGAAAPRDRSRPGRRPGRLRARFCRLLPALAALAGALGLFAAGPAMAQSSDSTLRALTVEVSTDGTNFSRVGIVPEFSASHSSYETVVRASERHTHMRVTATANHAGATLKVGKNVGGRFPGQTSATSGSPSEAIALADGGNQIRIRVTAQDRSSQDYVVTVYRGGRQGPAPPRYVKVTAGTAKLTLTWTAPAHWGSFPAGGYEVDWYAGASPPMDDSDWNLATPTPSPLAATATSYAFTGTYGTHTVADGTTYQLRIRALSTNPDDSSDHLVSDWTAPQAGTPPSGSSRSTDARLSALAAGSATSSTGTFQALTLTPSAFSAATTEYAASVANDRTHVKLTPTVNEANATVQVGKGSTLSPVTSGQASGPIALDVGANAITVRVTAHDGSTTKDYTVTVTRAAAQQTRSTNANLSALTAGSSTSSGGPYTDFSIGTFGATTTTYTASVANDRTHVKLTPTVADTGASVTVQGSSVTSGTASGPIALNVGANALTVRVTAEDRTTTKDYTVTVTRAAAAVPVGLSIEARPPCGTAVTDTSVTPKTDLVLNPAPTTPTRTEYRVVTVPTTETLWLSSGTLGGGGRLGLATHNSFAELTRAFPGFIGFEYRLTDRPSVTARCTWRIDDAVTTTPTVRLSASPNPVTEGSSVTVTATLSGALSSGVTIPLTITDDSAEPEDHGTLTGIAIASGATSGTGTITTAQDADTVDETFTVALGALPPAVTAGSPGSVRIRIRDDDRSGGGGGGGTPDLVPSFGSATVADRTYTQNTAITTLTLPRATGGDGTLTYRLTPGPPSGLALDAATRRLTGTPDTVQGPVRYTWTVRDADGDTDELTFTIEVEEDLVPSFGSATVADRTYTQNTAIATLTLPRATGGNGTLTYRLTPSPPSGLTLDAATRRLTGAPDTPQEPVRYTWTVRDADGDTDEITFAIAVEADLMPSFGDAVVADQSWTAGTAITALVLPEATGGDGTLTYRLTPAPPSGLSLDAATRTLTGTPARTQGSRQYTWTVRDADGDEATLTFAIAVAADPRRARIQGAVKRALAAVARRAMAGALDNIGARFGDIGASGLSLAGQWVPLEGSEAAAAAMPEDAAQRPCAAARSGSAGFGWTRPGCAAPWSRSMTAGELFGASAFSLHLGAAQGADGAAVPSGPLWSVWGRGELGSFAGRGEPGLRYDGRLRTGWLGIDARDGPWVAGLAVSHGTGEADYGFADGALAGRGRLETALTSVYPYGRWTLDDGLELRAVVGAGWGEARHRLEDGEAETGDLTMRMASLGVRRALPGLAGVALAVRADGSVTRIETGDGPDAIHGLSADSWRLRAGLEASRRFALADGSSLEPFLEAAVRRDGGDGLEGSGVELAGGLRWRAPEVSIEARGRWLAAHSADGAEETGLSVTVRAGPGADGRGLFLALSPRWGAGTGGARALWGEEMPKPAASGHAGAVDARIGYGIALPDRGQLTPFAEAGLAGGDSRRLRLGVRFEALHAAFGMELAGERRAGAAAGPEHALRLDLRLRF